MCCALILLFTRPIILLFLVCHTSNINIINAIRAIIQELRTVALKYHLRLNIDHDHEKGHYNILYFLPGFPADQSCRYLIRTQHFPLF